MGNFFTFRRAPSVIVTPQDRVILQLKQQRDRIKIYQNQIESKLEEKRQLAMKLFNNNMKERALVILRMKKNMEDVLKRTDEQLATLEQLVHDIENKQIEVGVVEGLKATSATLKQLNNMMSVENIQQILEDNQEAAEKQREISSLLRGSDRYEESELMDELAEMSEKVSLKLPDIPLDIPVDISEKQEELVPKSDENKIKILLPSA